MRLFRGESPWSARRITFAVLACIAVLAMVGTLVAGVIASFLTKDSPQAAPRTIAAPAPTAPVVIGAPLAVRPVLEVPLAATAQDCSSLPPAPPQDPARMCDVDKRAVFALGGIALRLNLTGAVQTKMPTSDFHTVQLSLDPASSAAFARYTAANLGRQLAFVRDGVVLAAPTISEPIDGQSLQITGDLSAATATTIARMLREGT